MEAFHPSTRDIGGFTLVEALVAIVVLGILLALAAPSFIDMIARQRVRGVNAELVSDLNYARSEAVRAGTGGNDVSITFGSDGTMSCYSIYVYSSVGTCTCTAPLAHRCVSYGGGPAPKEIRTTQVALSDGVSVTGPPAAVVTSFKAGEGHLPPPGLSVAVTSSRSGALTTEVNVTGRVYVCSPDGSISGVVRCNP